MEGHAPSCLAGCSSYRATPAPPCLSSPSSVLCFSSLGLPTEDPAGSKDVSSQVDLSLSGFCCSVLFVVLEMEPSASQSCFQTEPQPLRPLPVLCLGNLDQRGEGLGPGHKSGPCFLALPLGTGSPSTFSE